MADSIEKPCVRRVRSNLEVIIGHEEGPAIKLKHLNTEKEHLIITGESLNLAKQEFEFG